LFKTISLKLQSYIFILLFSTQLGFSQTHIYKHFSVDEGLPSSEVYDIYQDKLGYIWFATDKGLSCYNGYEFKNFTTKDGLPDNTILDFYPQPNGQVWCYGYHSRTLFYFNEVFDGFKSYKHNDLLKKELKPNSILRSVVLDEHGTLNTSGYNVYGLIKITDEGKVTNTFNLTTDIEKSYLERNTSIGFQSKKGTFFSVYHDYKSDENVFYFKSKGSPSSRLDFVFLNDEKTIFINKNLGVISRNGNIRYYKTEQNPTGIKKIDIHSFFVGYYGNGAEIMDVSGHVIEKFLPKKSVSSFLIDTEGSYWFSTIDDGVFYIKNPNIKVFNEDHISSLVKDNTNTLYAGYNNGNIVRISQTKLNTLYKGLNTDDALVEFDTKNKDIYGYSDGKLLNYTNPNKDRYITSANKLPEQIGNSLLSSSSTHFNKKEYDSIKRYVINTKIQDICDYNDATLIGTSSGLLIQKDEIIKKSQPLDILKSRIDDIDVNKNTNSVYMATQGHGVVVYGDHIYSINKKSGLTNNIVSEVHIENDSTVWACTNSGLNRIAFKTNNTYDISTITKSDGLLSNDINDIEIINDTVWVATKKGLCFFKKDFLAEKTTSTILSLTLKNVTVNNTSIYEKNIQLNYNENDIDFELQAISHRNNNKINYLYRLKEVDTNWASTSNRNINFPSLSPGNYTFEAKANVFNNKNNILVSYAFKISPPFWKSWWFYNICIALCSGLVYVFFKIRVLTYNQDVFRELIRLGIKRLKRKEQIYKFRSNGEDFKISTHQILYIQSQGNYLDITTNKKTYTIRCKIGDFISGTPDALEYLRVHRSYIIRIDQVSSKGKNWVVVKDKKIPVGQTYLSELDKIHF